MITIYIFYKYFLPRLCCHIRVGICRAECSAECSTVRQNVLLFGRMFAECSLFWYYISEHYMVTLWLLSADPFEPACVSTFSNLISPPPFVGLYGLSDCIWFLKSRLREIWLFYLLFIYCKYINFTILKT